MIKTTIDLPMTGDRTVLRSGAIAKYSEAVPRYSEAVAEYSEVVSRYPEAIAKYSEAVPKYSEAIPRYSEAIPRYSEVVSRYSEATNGIYFTIDHAKSLRKFINLADSAAVKGAIGAGTLTQYTPSFKFRVQTYGPFKEKFQSH